MLSTTLREQIVTGKFKTGERLPSEAQLTAAHGVSRTVVREAIAALRSDGLVEARQGAGVFVNAPALPQMLPFQGIDYDRISSVIEMLELRTAVESEAAALAAVRRSPQQEERLISCHRAVLAAMESGGPTAEADFALHQAVADAANNPRFSEFLGLMGNKVIPRAALQITSQTDLADYLAQLHREHERIVDAISSRDEEGAREAMRRHLKGSQARYRALQLHGRPNI